MKHKCSKCDHMHEHMKEEKKEHKHHKETPKEKSKVKKVMHEYKEGELHSGSKKGPMVSNPRQAIAIALSESRKASKKKK